MNGFGRRFLVGAASIGVGAGIAFACSTQCLNTHHDACYAGTTQAQIQSCLNCFMSNCGNDCGASAAAENKCGTATASGGGGACSDENPLCDDTGPGDPGGGA